MPSIAGNETPNKLPPSSSERYVEGAFLDIEIPKLRSLEPAVYSVMRIFQKRVGGLQTTPKQDSLGSFRGFSKMQKNTNSSLELTSTIN
jgi:hypothetical protein